jgi:trigger factor
VPAIIDTVKISTEQMPDSQVVLQIEVEPERMETSLNKAYRRLVQRVQVPGFRKGKTPRPMLERHVGRDRLLHEALDILIPEAYNQAIDEHGVDPIDQPVIEVIKEEPLAFKATVPVKPTIELGDYQSLRVNRDPVEVDPKHVDEAVEELRHRYAVHEPVDRAVQVGDIVRADVRGVIEDKEVYKDEDVEFHLREGAVILLPGFAEGLVGAEKGVPKEISVSAPPGSQPLSGKEGTFTAVVTEIKQEQLPEVNDEFAGTVGEGFSSVKALRDELESNARGRFEAQAEEAYRDKAVDALVEQAERIEFPPVMVEREIDHLLRDQARAAGQDVDRYIEMMRRPVEQLREDIRAPATERVRRSLALTRLAEDEQIIVEKPEVDAEIERMVGSMGQQGPQMRRLFSSDDARMALERSVLTRKTVERLVEITGQDSRNQETAKSKKRSKKKKETEVQ